MGPHKYELSQLFCSIISSHAQVLNNCIGTSNGIVSLERYVTEIDYRDRELIKIIVEKLFY